MIELKNATKIYEDGTVGIENVNLIFPQTGIIGILGTSGSGKSTLLNCLGGLDSFSSGDILFNHEPVDNIKEYCCYVFQEYKLIEEFSVYQNLSLAAKNVQNGEIDRLLEVFGLKEHAKDKVNEISGGQRQRVEIIRALLQKTDILLCDEPFANLDKRTGQEILSLLKEQAKDKLIIVVSHDIDLLEKNTDGIIRIENHHILMNPFSTLECEIKEYAKASVKKLSWRDSNRFSLMSFKKNKFMFFMTILFMTISMIILSTLILVLRMNFADISYQILDKNWDRNNYIEYYIPGKEGFLAIPLDYAEDMGANYIYHNNIHLRCNFKNNPAFLEFLDCFETIDGTFDTFQLKDNEILINESFLNDLSINPTNLIGQELMVGDYTLLICGTFYSENKLSFSSEKQPSLVLNSLTYEIIKGNYSQSFSIVIENENSYSEVKEIEINFLNRFDKNYTNASEKIVEGRLPKSSQEICVSSTWLKNQNFNSNELLNQEVSFKIKSPFSNQFKEVALKIVGVHPYNWIMNEQDYRSFAGEFNLNSCEFGIAYVCMEQFEREILRKALTYNMLTNVRGHETSFIIFKKFQNYSFIFVLTFCLFIGITIISIMNFFKTILLESEKNIGVLLCCKIQKLSLIRIFVLSSFFILLFSFFITISCFHPIYMLLENIAHRNTRESDGISFIHFFDENYGIIIILLISAIGVSLISLLLPFLKLLKKKPNELLEEGR